jgi:hypothetical protein
MIYTLYLSTLSTLNPPTINADLANVSWNVNFRDFFGADLFDKLKGNTTVVVKAKIISQSVLTTTLNDTDTIPQDLYVGNVIISLPNAYAGRFYNSQNGISLGSIQPVTDGILNTYSYFMMDTTLSNSSGADVTIPFENGNLNISIYDNTESTLIANMQDYQIWLYFEVPNHLLKMGDPLNDKPIGRAGYVADVNTIAHSWR